MKSDKEIISETVKLILKERKNDVEAILLFGSHADSTNIWRSDIDICVVLKKDASLKEATLFRINLLGKLPDKVDLQVFNVLPLKIKKTIADNHQVLFSSSNFDDFSFTKRNRALFFEFDRKIAAIES